MNLCELPYWGCNNKMKNSDYKATGSISQQVISDHEKSVSASVFVSPHLCEFVSPLFSVGFFCTPPFCRFRVCYLDFALSLDSVVSFFNFQNHWLGMCYSFIVILTRARLVFLLPHFVWLNQLKYGISWEYINNSEYT